MIIRFLIFLAFIYLAFRLVKYLAGQTTRLRADYEKPNRELDNIMIKDPVCGVYFPRSEGVLLKQEGRDIYFCSEECREKFLGNPDKF